MRGAVSIKGTREGLTITLGQGEYAELFAELEEHLKTQGAFFRGAKVALQVADRALDQERLGQVSELLARSEMTLRTVVTSSAETQRAVNALGLRLLEPTPSEGETVSAIPASPDADAEPRPAVSRPVVSTPAPVMRSGNGQEGSRGTLVRRLVRSGQVVRHTGHVVVIGDVNVGAEIIAGGDIVIWGHLFGTAHAGAMGDEQAVVCALDLTPLQLRIGNHVARPGEDASAKRRAPEVASVRDGAIVVQPWDSLGRFGV